MKEIHVSQQACRRFLLESLQLGGRSRASPTSVQAHLRALEAVQIDPVARVGRNQDLVFCARWSRYRPAALDRLLAQGLVFEYRAQEACVLPMDDYPILKGTRTRTSQQLTPLLERYPDTVRHVLDRIAAEGPLPSRAFVSSTRVQGYWDTDTASTKETSLVLNLLVDAGRLMVARRQGVTRFFDVAERVVPAVIWDASQLISSEESDERLFDKYLRAYRLINGRNGRLGWSRRPMAERRQQLQKRTDDGRVAVVRVDGVPGPYYVLAEDADRLLFWNAQGVGWGRPIRFLPPLDNLLWDRQRVVDLFEFFYRWEVYVPSAKREFGVYAMPILAGDRLVGRIDPEIDRPHSIMVVRNVRLEPWVKATPTLTRALDRALEAYARRLGADDIDMKQSWNGGGHTRS